MINGKLIHIIFLTSKTLAIILIPLFTFSALSINALWFLLPFVIHLFYFGIYKGYCQGEYYHQPYQWLMNKGE